MAKEKGGSRKKDSNNSNQSSEAVLNLTIDGSYPDAEVREIAPSQTDAFQTPCSVSGLMAGASGGTLGYVFGFAGYWMRNRLQGNLRASLSDGLASAKTFAVMGGLYAAVSCFMQRLRQKQDAWNGAVSGCATGLALGWSGGPASAAQSCAMLGIFSYFLDGMSGVEANAAHAAGIRDRNAVKKQKKERRAREAETTAAGENNALAFLMPLDKILSPAVALAPCFFGVNCNGVGATEAWPGNEKQGCKVVAARSSSRQKL